MPNRLATAHAEFVAALQEERAEIDRLLGLLQSAVPAPRSGKLTPPRPTTLAGIRGRAARGGNGKAKPHGVPGKPGVVMGERKGKFTCPGCGRDELPKGSGPGGYMAFHRAPCGLVCAAINLDRLDPEEKREGVHSRKNCPKCSRGRGAGSEREATTHG